MNRENRYRRILYGLIVGVLVLGMTACGGKGNGDAESQVSQSQKEEGQDLYMVTENNTREETLCLRSLDTGLENYYEYGQPTRFKDKYGTLTSSIAFTPGRIITIGPIDPDGYLTEAVLSNEVWEYEKVKRFSIDEEKGIFTIADTKYSIRDKVVIFSNGKQIPFSYISKEDELTVVGIGKKILSINVTTGHGTLSLSNTELFEDSFLQLNTDIFALITGEMDLELPEGTYNLKVANDGWGGTKEITIVRDETTEVDLDSMKGEGRKKGRVSFDINVEDVEVYIDYEKIDHTQTIELTYGTHVLQIEAEGYDTWKKYLSVNSEEATLVIELTEDEGTDNTEVESTQVEDTEVETEVSETVDTQTENTETESSETESMKAEE